MIYRRIRDLREDNDLTQDQIVQKLQMHKTTYTNYEQGKREPTLSFIIQIADFYDVSIDYIVGRSDYQKPANKVVRMRDVAYRY